MDYRFSRTQQNDIVKYCRHIGLDPATLDMEDAQEGKVAFHKLSHRGTGAYLLVRYFPILGHCFVSWPQLENLPRPSSNWTTTLPAVLKWLDTVKAESDAPDLWALAHQGRALLASTSEEMQSNTPFTETERELIGLHLKTIEEYTIRTYALQAEQAEHVRSNLKYLVEAADRVGRFDWKNLAAATVVNIVVTLGLDIEKTQQLVAFVTELLGPIVLGVSRFLQAGLGHG
jgi:hypothetical protein